MTEVVAGGKTVDVAPAEAQRAIQKGRAEAAGVVQLVKGNEAGEVDAADLPTALAQGWRVADAAEQKAAKLRAEESDLGSNIQGGAEAIGRGLTLGASDVALRAMGVDTERMKARKEMLGGGSQLLELAGGVGGVGALAGRGVAAAGRGLLGESALARVATGAGSGAVEGALQGAGVAASEAALGDRDLAAEQLLAGGRANVGLGALLGGGAATLGLGLERAYTGSQRVARGLVEKAVGVGDDATSAAGRASLAGDNLITAAARRQVKLLGGTDVHIAAAERALARTRTASGRKLAELASGPSRAIDDAVGGRLRDTVGKAGAGDAVRAWGTRIKASEGGRKLLAKQAGEAAESLRGVQGRGAAKVRQLLRAESRGIADYKAYSYGRNRLAKTLQRMEDAGDPALARAQEAARPYLAAASDDLVWGKAATAREAVLAGQAAEKELLAGLRPKVRAALTGGEIDNATARMLAQEPAVPQLMEVRAKVADALEGVGEDVTGLRKSLDDVKASLRYRDEVTAAAEDLRLLDELEGGPGKTARTGLKMAGRTAGAILGGLSFGGVALGETTGKLLGAATRPASAVRVLARARGGIDAVRSRQGASIKAFADLADGAADAAKKGGRRVGRAAPRVAPKLARQQQRQRQTELLDTIRRVGVMATDPTTVSDEMESATRHLRLAAPNVTNAIVAGASRAVAYLRSVAPVIYKPPFSGGVEMVDPFELDAYERKLFAVKQPLDAMDMLGKGTLTRDHAEAIQAVYPSMFAELQERIVDIVGDRARSGRPVSLSARTVLGSIGSVLTDDSLRPQDFAMIQGSMAGPPVQPEAPPPPAGEIKPPPLSAWQRMESGA